MSVWEKGNLVPSLALYRDVSDHFWLVDIAAFIGSAGVLESYLTFLDILIGIARRAGLVTGTGSYRFLVALRLQSTATSCSDI